ncbi:MAG: hypothetical protein ABSH41_00335 [Syntrophobacteraceae bacterium]|jgi:hypothetical protein
MNKKIQHTLVLLCAVGLGACKAEIKKDFAQCQVEAIKVYPGDAEAFDKTWRERDNFVTACMSAQGYDKPGCGEFGPGWFCFSPSDEVGKFFDKLERKSMGSRYYGD